MDALINQGLDALALVVAAAIPVITAYIVGLIRSKWFLSNLIVTDKRVANLNEGIINIVKGELEKLKQEAVTSGTIKADANLAMAAPTMDARRMAVESALPKVQVAFKETLAELGKKPDQVRDMIFARVEAATVKPEAPVVPFPLNKG